jgi:hypothetical protein
MSKVRPLGSTPTPEPLVRRGWMSFEPGETLKPYDCTLLAPPSAAPEPAAR